MPPAQSSFRLNPPLSQHFLRRTNAVTLTPIKNGAGYQFPRRRSGAALQFQPFAGQDRKVDVARISGQDVLPGDVARRHHTRDLSVRGIGLGAHF